MLSTLPTRYNIKTTTKIALRAISSWYQRTTYSAKPTNNTVTCQAVVVDHLAVHGIR